MKIEDSIVSTASSEEHKVCHVFLKNWSHIYIIGMHAEITINCVGRGEEGRGLLEK